MALRLKKDPALCIGELIWIRCYENIWGWAIYVGSIEQRLHDEESVLEEHLALFKGRVIQIDRNEFKRFLWYNRHLFS